MSDLILNILVLVGLSYLGVGVQRTGGMGRFVRGRPGLPA
jgi:hypothetical protein